MVKMSLGLSSPFSVIITKKTTNDRKKINITDITTERK
ncbi:hypothetical protein SAMN05443633_103429 [Chryseobacterium arachidis]|uniref:Uncharacterized protein n=1 Tax=Chryseobacterium arachidis TaxID=1416778 RepID=A0A1M5ABG2_9FLAO|nr:hypothetical protein SAMN05443633_103429 [Chryseobacterium arachidis]